MKKLSVLFASIILGPGAALAHPGHGKPDLFHLHDADEPGPWLLLVVVILGVACWKLLRKP